MNDERRLRLAVLLSGAGSTLENLLRRAREGRLAGEVVAVVSSRPDVRGVDIARAWGIPTYVVTRADAPTASALSAAVDAALAPHAPDLLLLAGFLRKLAVLPHWEGRMMNIHPSLLPAFGGKGYYGARVHEAVIASGAKVSGCTVHFVDEEYDHGPYIIQRCIPVDEDDTPATLAERVAALEREVYPEAVRLFAEGRLAIEGRRVRVRPGP